MRSQSAVAVVVDACGVASTASALAERLGLTGAPRGAWTTPELPEPAWNARIRPITRPSATGTASWRAIRAPPLRCPPRRPAGRRPLCTRPASLPAVSLLEPYVRPAGRPDAANSEDLVTCPALLSEIIY